MNVHKTAQRLRTDLAELRLSFVVGGPAGFRLQLQLSRTWANFFERHVCHLGDGQQQVHGGFAIPGDVFVATALHAARGSLDARFTPLHHQLNAAFHFAVE